MHASSALAPSLFLLLLHIVVLTSGLRHESDGRRGQEPVQAQLHADGAGGGPHRARGRGWASPSRVPRAKPAGFLSPPQ
ncbi:hypothetical protein F4809DRAFT_634432 [Biscogniauxia mediterranea]|nr:hypothetical protein F4809DRAFT_634432 [Biscogniauxia mediterranea]